MSGQGHVRIKPKSSLLASSATEAGLITAAIANFAKKNSKYILRKVSIVQFNKVISNQGQVK